MFKRLFSALVLISSLSQAFICRQVEVLYNKDRDQTIFIYPDGHIDANEAREQRSLIVWQANMLNKHAAAPGKGVCVFVEDMLTVCHPHEQMPLFVKQQRAAQNNDLNKQVLNGLVEQLEQCGVPTVNAEFRQLETASLCRLRVNASDAIDYLYQVINELKNSTVEEKYKKIIITKVREFERLIEPVKPFIESLRADDASLGKMLLQTKYDPAIDRVLNRMHIGPPPNDQEERKVFLMNYYDVPILEARIFDEIGKRPEVKNIIVVAGGAHTSKLVPMLKQVGCVTQSTYRGTHVPQGCTTHEKIVDLQQVLQDYCPALPSATAAAKAPTIPSEQPVQQKSIALVWALLLATCLTAFTLELIVIGRHLFDQISW